jgi:hypothetical protein
VTGLAPRPNRGAGWTVSIEEGGRTLEKDFDLVVIATGLFSDTPNLPAIPGQEDFQGAVLPISEIVGVGEATVKTRMFYARRKLATLVAAG